jgi:hypothetical protein
LVESGGEPYRSHPEAAAVAGAMSGRPVLVFVQLSDTHVMDSQSLPGRPGVLDAARKPFQASGLRIPWYSGYGNHDNQLQGTVSATPALDSVATGAYKLVTPPPTLDAGDVLARLEAGDISALDRLAGAAGILVRYLVAVDPAYMNSLSSASQASLVRQGGAATPGEVRAWAELEWWPQVLLLRHCDDQAKIPGATTLRPVRFRPVLARLAASRT